jgi:predicted RNA-binding Zn-ribbon protein involved in translation (DUF1610 family)
MENELEEEQEIVCNNCGTIWRIQRHWEYSDIIAEIWKCPICASKERRNIK